MRALLVASVALLLLPAPAAARYQHTGFDLNALVAAAGTGPDPGTGSLPARLKWAVETAIPQEWRESVPVDWTVGGVTAGHLALSYLDGRTVLSPRVMSRSAEEVLATVAHEMGHQIAFALVSPVLGYPPQGFIDLAPPYEDVREAWADCVSRVWTGSLVHTRSERGPCGNEMADYVAGLVADPATLGATTRIVPPPILVPAPPAEPEPVPEPVVAPPPPALPAVERVAAALLTAGARPRSVQIAAPAPAADRTDGLPVALALIPLPLLLCAVGYWLVRSRNPRLLAWASGSSKGH